MSQSTGWTQNTAGEDPDQASRVSSTPAEKTSQVADTAVEGGRRVAETAQEGAREVASTAVEQMSEVADHAADEARDLVDQSKQRLRSEAESQTDQIAMKLRELGEQMRALADGRPADAGPVADYASQAADRVTRLARRMDERGLDGIVNDVERFARRRPGMFLLGAVAAGFGIGRLIRGGALSGSAGQSDAQSTRDTGRRTAVGGAASLDTGDQLAMPRAVGVMRQESLDMEEGDW